VCFTIHHRKRLGETLESLGIQGLDLRLGSCNVSPWSCLRQNFERLSLSSEGLTYIPVIFMRFFSFKPCNTKLKICSRCRWQIAFELCFTVYRLVLCGFCCHSWCYCFDSNTDTGQVIHTHVPLTPNCVIWYRFHC